MLCSLVNLFLVAFVFPESLSASKRAVRREVEAEERKTCASATVGSFLWCFVAPLMVFAPKVRDTHGAGRRRDWSITFLALALFAYMLSLVCISCFLFNCEVESDQGSVGLCRVYSS